MKKIVILFTKEGFDDTKKELGNLVSQRPSAVEDLKKAREMGDLSENGYYKSARFKLSGLDRRIRELSSILKYARIEEKNTTGEVGINSKVSVYDGKTTHVYTIVGEYESNPMKGKISHKSPLGKSLMGKKKNEKISVTTPSGITTYTILEIY